MANGVAILAMLGICITGSVVVWKSWPHPAERFIVDPGKTPDFDDKDGTCVELNRLEAEVAAALRNKLPDANLGEYEKHLQQWRRAHPGYQPSCRTEALGKLLCLDGADLNDLMPPPTDDPWDGWMRQLASRENATEHCQAFEAKFVPKSWEPHVFHWGEQVPETLLDDVLADSEYGTFAAAMHLAPPYGAPQLMFRQRPQGRFRMGRVEHVNQFRMLRKAVPGTEVANLRQIVEFGGGGGDVPAMFRDLGFAGTHFVYDFPPMLLMQRYWLQYSGLPAYLGKDMPTAKSASGKTVLVNTYTKELSSLLDKDVLRDSFFLATFSFTEADLASRWKVWNDIKAFGIINIIFWKEFYGIDNMKTIKDILESGIQKTHSVLLWALPRHWHATTRDAFSFVAVRRDRGKAECVADMGCSPDSRVTFSTEL